MHGLVYPEPNRSHFKSISLWESGGDGRRPGRDGWITHDIEHQLSRAVADAHGISLAGSDSLFKSDTGRWMSMKSALSFARSRVPADTGGSAASNTLAMIARWGRVLESMTDGMGAKISRVPRPPALEGGPLGRQLTEVLHLIRGGVDTPVYRVQLGGFDTHENQASRQAKLLATLGSALTSFADTLRADGEWNETLITTYSEFGRRAAENVSGGTDHGTASPHLVLGGAVAGGLFGTPPDLGNLVDGDPTFTLDYRTLYERVLSDWLGIEDNRHASYRGAGLASLIT